MAKKAWGGVFDQATDQRVEKFSESHSFDRRLYEHDVRGSIAHARMLVGTGMLTDDEFQQIRTGLEAIRDEIAAGKFEFTDAKEDVHMHIESALIEQIGDTGRKLHTGRSRNDQVSTDMRLWVRDAIDQLRDLLLDVQRAFVGRCDADFDVTLPGYTHMQRAQPILAPHYWLAYCEKFERDRERLADCRRRANRLSLGAAALAGTSLPIDRHAVAEDLGFESVAANSVDVSSDRDFMVEFAFAMTMVAEHMSTLAEEWIIWSTVEFNFIRPPQAFCTGSSIMPQKVNPDVLELIRGKTARVVGNLQSLLVLIKGLPLAYNRDLQEDKQPLFDSFDTVRAALELVAPLVAGMELNRASIAERLDRGHLDATTFMEYLIGRGIPQRTAHGLVGRLVRKALDANCRLADLPIEDYKEAHEDLDESVYEILGVDRALQAFQSYGSTAPAEVRKQVDLWKERLEI